uniref:Uncharacterized protein n=1 Tax=Pseudomonas phage Orisa03 TaxID=3138542 RepID=A0AAU6W387_9VIRU
MRGDLLAALEAHKGRIAKAMIGGGEGARVRHALERVSLSGFEAGWQAYRESMVIELPAYRTIRRTPMPDENSSYNEAIENCRDSILAAGVKVKS